MSLRKIQQQRTRRRIIEAALEEFAQRGISATGTLDVARRAGVAHGTVFLHFQTRDDLVVAVIEAFGEKMVDEIHRQAGGAGGLRGVLETCLDVLKRYEGFYRSLLTERHLLSSRCRDTLVYINAAISYHLFDVAQDEMNRGRIKSMPMHLLFNTWMGLVEHYILYRELFAPGGSVMKRCGQEILDHFMRLVTTANALDGPGEYDTRP